MLLKNEVITVTIEDVTLKGDGIARKNGFVIFVPNSFTGDVLKIHILKVTKDFARAKIIEILTPSPARISIDCECFERCGGCTFRHISYKAECELKNKIVKDTFLRIGKIDLSPEPIIGYEHNYYRNKVSYPVGYVDNKAVFGFYARHSNRIIEHKHCYIQNEQFYNIAEEIIGYCNLHNIDILRHIVIRQGFYSKELSFTLVVTRKTDAFKDLKIPHVLNINKTTSNTILGEKFLGDNIISDTICGKKIFLTPDSFYQVNTPQAEVLYGIAKEFLCLSKDDTVLDLYCGVGTISMYLSDYAKKVIGIELGKNAVKNAKRGKYANNAENTEFFCQDVADLTPANLDKPLKIVIDPPRKGCSSIKKIAELNAEKIVMISCDVGTAARDCAEFQKKGYTVKKIQPVDMFPRTGNIECVILLIKEDNAI
ncbi:MAG: 23S rRNA (uracil(1939)-C(5))-methyltransferase RlmD [Oscillospiraceae bacterium]|jgi:23S rRNA (uracil1939-C5)-methyltransferase|nr:23S rRNA (uracil(1939)-C(5))-methyltransferase RlmD [Oscillospiraceae bacterium]